MLKEKLLFCFISAVMQTDGFDYLKQSCPSVISELLLCVARVSEHSVVSYDHGDEASLDGADMNCRRVKQRIYWENKDQISPHLLSSNDCNFRNLIIFALYDKLTNHVYTIKWLLARTSIWYANIEGCLFYLRIIIVSCNILPADFD